MPKKPSDSGTDPAKTHELRTTLRASMDQAEWPWIAKHLERQAVIIISPGLDIIEAGVAIALDDAAQVELWISGGKISKPTREQVDTWDATPRKMFQTLVVQPYVLVQEFLH